MIILLQTVLQTQDNFEGFKQFTAELDELQELDNEHAIKLLTDWNTIEAKEYAKIAIGRVKTIEQFEKFIQTNAWTTHCIYAYWK